MADAVEITNDAVADFAALMGGELEETGRRDDTEFDPTWEFAELPVLMGRYQGFRSVKTKHGQRKVHKFADAAVGSDPDSMESVGNIEAWGSTVLDQRMDDYEKGDRLLIKYEGQAEGSNAHIYRTYKAKGVASNG